MTLSLSEALVALRRDPTLSRAVKTRLGHLTLDPDQPYTWAETLATLRAPGALLSTRARVQAVPHLDALAARCAAALCARGHDPGTTAVDAWALAERLRIGCWIASLPPTWELGQNPGTTLLGGILWEAVPALAQPPEPVRDGLFAALAAGPRVTRWSVLLDQHPAPERPRLEKVRCALEAARLVGAPHTRGDWISAHYIAFVDGPPMYISQRAWGDLQSALTGEGSYLDWYF